MLVPEPLGKAADYHSVGEKVSISTWNVWFDKRERDVRNRALLEELGRIRPDICCFQEVTPPFVRALQACPWMEDDYWISGTHHQDIGVVIVSRLEAKSLQFCSLSSQMGRRLLVADFGALTVGCAHFESTVGAAETRSRQFSESLEHLRSGRASVLLGDFNCAPDSEESETLAGLVDCWEVLRPGEQGFTLDPERNFCAQKQNRSHPLGVRMDRILTDGRVAATHVGLISLQPIGEGLHCSDHFGLYADLRPDL